MVGKISNKKIEINKKPITSSIFLDAKVNALTRVGVIDVGSNSVRLVVFDGAARSPSYFFNENIFCGLGQDVNADGSLNIKSRERAFAALSRFALLVKNMKIFPIVCVATAAVREASDQLKFCQDVFNKTGLDLKVLTGIEEARLSAQGVFLGWPEAQGIMCDIGGSSLELASLGDGIVKSCSSVPLGPLKLTKFKKDQRLLRYQINKRLMTINGLSDFSGKDLYLVGGSWRAIARLDMERRKYPLKVLHEYQMTEDSILKTVKWVLSQDIKELGSLTGISKSRLKLVPVAAQVLRSLVKKLKPKSVSLSSYGIREGVLYEQMPYKLKRCDPLLEACRLDEEQNARISGFGLKLFKFLSPLFQKCSNRKNRLIKSACLLHDVNWRAHPDYRAEVCFDNATRANLGGLSHKERIFLGVSLLHRYKNSRLDTQYEKVLGLLTTEELKEAEILGKAMRFGAMFSIIDADIPAKLHWDSKMRVIRLTLRPKSRRLYGEVVQARFLSLAKSMESRIEVL